MLTPSKIEQMRQSAMDVHSGTSTPKQAHAKMILILIDELETAQASIQVLNKKVDEKSMFETVFGKRPSF